MLKHIITEQHHNTRIDKTLSEILQTSRSKVQKMIDYKSVSINDIIATRYNTILQNNDVVQLCYNDYMNSHDNAYDLSKITSSSKNIDLEIPYEDEFLLVVNKPAGMCTHPGIGNIDDTLVNVLLSKNKTLASIQDVFRPGIVHRLDKDTSGLLVVAKNEDVHYKLSEQLRNKYIIRKYKAVVHGILAESTSTINASIGKDKYNYAKKAVVYTNGREAVTHYKVLQIFPKSRVSFLELTLDTGRTHQIRVHMNHIGHSIVGDPVYQSKYSKLYSYKINSLVNNIDLNYRKQEDHLDELQKYYIAFSNLQRQALHSYYMKFTHPITFENIEIESKLPQDIDNILQSAV